MSKYEKAKQRPHPGDVMKPGAVKQLVEYLIQIGELL